MTSVTVKVTEEHLVHCNHYEAQKLSQPIRIRSKAAIDEKHGKNARARFDAIGRSIYIVVLIGQSTTLTFYISTNPAAKRAEPSKYFAFC